MNSGIFQVIHALIWAVAIIGGTWAFRDEAWAYNIAIWGPLAFVFMNGIFMSLFYRRNIDCQ